MSVSNQDGGDVVAEGDLVVQIGEMTAGGEAGAAILNDVTLTLNRDNTLHHGIGHRDPQDHTQGNKTYELDSEAQVDRSVYEAIKEMYDSGVPAEGMMFDNGESQDRGDTINAELGTIVWNQIDIAASDGDDVTMSFTADCYDVEL